MRIWPLTVLAVMVLGALPAGAYNESEAAQVRLMEDHRSDVVRVWHEPPTVQPGTQWRGFIQFSVGNAMENVSYQICRVGFSCFAPPTPADRLNATTWTFDTNRYLSASSRQPVSWEAGWRVGMRFVLSERLPNGTLASDGFPKGLANDTNLEYHYLAFDMPPAPPKRGVPGPSLTVAGASIAVAGLLARRR